MSFLRTIRIAVANVLNPEQAADLHSIADSLHGIDESLSALLANHADPVIVGEVEAGTPVEQSPVQGA